MAEDLSHDSGEAVRVVQFAVIILAMVVTKSLFVNVA
jgi:hypothetical protein